MIYYFPANPVGVIFFFHGKGGAASNWFAQVENRYFLRDAVAAGYAVVALDSTDRVNEQWDASVTSANVDLVNVQAAIQYLSANGVLAATTPKFSVGMSNGGLFAPKPAKFLGFRACGIWCSTGEPSQFFTNTYLPTVWSLEEYDDLYNHTTILPAVQADEASLTAQKPTVPAVYRENPPSPVYSRRFLRIPNLTAADSQNIYNALNNAGYLDANGYLLADPNTSGWQSVLTPYYSLYQTEILAQLVCCYSQHQFFSDYDDKVLQFFNAQPAPFFAGAVALSGGTSYLAFPENGNIFGYYAYLADPPYIYHFDLGYEYVFDAQDGVSGVYLYDFASDTFFYTSPLFPFPYLYDFTLNSVVYYYPDPTNPGHYNTDGIRYFYVFSTGQIISK